MTEAYRTGIRTGGCQCGAVRFRASELLDNPHVCHCRMCQKAMGNMFAALVGVKHEHLTWTRGRAATFRSSEHVDRGFCKGCGTPLFYHYLPGAHVSLTIGSFDEPNTIPILYQMGLEGRHPSIGHLEQVEEVGTTEQADGVEAVAAIKASNHQHPDHDTANWP
jgi:hypothetical protein